MVAPLIDQLAALNPGIIIHSDMVRTRAVALPLARRLGIVCMAEPAWRERDFGDWEGQSWNAIYRATGSAMDGMISAPGSFRPGGGETTNDVIARIKRALEKLPNTPVIVILSHGGPIACARLIRNNLLVSSLPSLIPALGETVTLEQAA